VLDDGMGRYKDLGVGIYGGGIRRRSSFVLEVKKGVYDIMSLRGWVLETTPSVVSLDILFDPSGTRLWIPVTPTVSWACPA
jgi:hypothetical protein